MSTQLTSVTTGITIQIGESARGYPASFGSLAD
jgi:hypothetical protein